MKRKNFKLKKVKLLKGDGLEAHWISAETEGAETFNSENLKKSTKDIHPDLTTKIRSLDEIVMAIRGYNDFKLVLESSMFGANGAQKAAIEKTLHSIKERVDVSGISINGDDEKKKVSITFKFEEDSKQVVGSSTHAIYLSQEKYGYEEDLQNIVEEIEDEVYAYLFEGKRSQQQIQFGETISED